jgi:integrase
MSRKPASKRTRPKPKAVLRLPDLDQAKSAVLNSLTSADAQRGYRHAIEEFVEWYCSEPRLSFSRTVVIRYRIHLESRNLAPGTINLRLGAVRRLAYEAADCGLLSPDLAAGVRRVKGVKKIGVRLGNWLTAEQSQRLWQAPNGERMKEKRDRALLAILLACGVRRHEAVNLNLGHIQQREEHRAIVDQRLWVNSRCRKLRITSGYRKCRTKTYLSGNGTCPGHDAGFDCRGGLRSCRDAGWLYKLHSQCLSKMSLISQRSITLPILPFFLISSTRPTRYLK